MNDITHVPLPCPYIESHTFPLIQIPPVFSV